jgi:uncharacterized protein
VTNTNTYNETIQDWRAAEEAKLRAEDGWLTVVGLEWLQERANTVGSSSDCDVNLPGEAIPAQIGVLHLHNGQITFRVTTNEPVFIDDAQVEQANLRVYQYQVTPTYVKVGSITFFIIQRGDRYGVRIRDANSVARRTFGGRVWFPIDPAYRVTAQFIAYPTQRKLEVETSFGITTLLNNLGVLEFDLCGQSLRVEAFHDGDDAEPELLWLIFRDATSGVSTYAASRFLKVPLAPDGTALVDFNRAYHPPCAFTDFATCPLPPPQNRLTIAIEAGEKLP